MAASLISEARASVDGKFFRLGGRKFFPKGVAYGPFAPNGASGNFPPREQASGDFAQIRELGANLIRVYEPPPTWLLDLASANELKVFVDIPWNQHLCFLDSKQQRRDARQAVRNAVRACGRHPAVFAYSVANEIRPDIVRWSGAGAIERFIDELIIEARNVDPDCLTTFSNYPPTEYLRPECPDFLCFNVYLHDRQRFKSYLARLQMIADTRPLMLGEFGADSLREGEDRKSEMLSWQIETAFRAGLAGTIVFSFTDDWWRGGERVEDWFLGLTTRERQPKDSFAAVQKQYAQGPRFALERTPKVSVVVACFNGGRTLAACLDSLELLKYPDYEIILVDDGSTDETASIAARHPGIRYFRHPKNLGLSVARNTGIAAATGEIVAFTDADCRADEDWLYLLVRDLLDSNFAGMGGHNLPPLEDSSVAAAVLVSPGGPAHVMLTDRQAEHVPGCNMAFYKSALDAIGGFDPVFRRAGDDVDVCWRLQEHGYKIGFSPAGFVWHYRRSTIRAYLRQQSGYGEAEALLVRKHPEYFNSLGGNIWRGRIYSPARLGITTRRTVIYRGVFGTGFFQTLYTPPPAGILAFFTSVEYHVLLTAPLLVLSAPFHFLFPVAMASLGLSAAVCVTAAAQARIPRRKRHWWSRPLVALLFFLQPIVRGAARYEGRLTRPPLRPQADGNLNSAVLQFSETALNETRYWSEGSPDRVEFLEAAIERLEKRGWPRRLDLGWSEFDVEIYGNRWSCLQLITAAEDYPHGRRMIRCRLKPRWTLFATVAFWLSVAVELLVIGLVDTWWIWGILLTVPVLIWFLMREKRKLQSVIMAILDELAAEKGLVKMPREAVAGKEPAQSAEPAKFSKVAKS